MSVTAPRLVRPLILGTYVPALLFDLGIGAVLPVIVTRSLDLGTTLVVAGLITALLGFGKLVANIPAGWLAARIGDRRAMLVATVIALAALTVAWLVESVVVFAVAIGVTGAAWAVFNLARHSFLTDVVPFERRARALSTLAGVHRIGLFLGPVVGAVVVAIFDASASFAVAIAAAAAAYLFVQFTPDPDVAPTPSSTPAPRVVPGGRARVFATLGTSVLLIGAVRGIRTTVLPVWAAQLGFDATTTSVIFAVSNLLDMLLFYPSGMIMDRLGRLWVAVPSMLVMAAAFGLLPLTSDFLSFAAVAALLGVGNGLGSGIVMTLGSDVAPPGPARARHLGLWRVFQDVGDTGGPALISAGVAVGMLSASVWIGAGISVIAATMLWRWVPDYVPVAARPHDHGSRRGSRRRRSRRAARRPPVA
ncbi:MFS transporter [Microbacterium oleivorans]|uniref:MFS transporter n=1 Tax=Microbacterium oleivorans TaxID=273677 RepID=UPI00203C1608|nr:MFS transporter [Microbacterium oleivorans]MCM3695923.1 MFS transporter [Microbacterium oleivorans]